MSIPILKAEDVTYKEDDPINTGVGLDKIIEEEDKRVEEEDGLVERAGNNGGSKKDIRTKIIEFVKGQGYLHTPGEKEFDDESSDLFAKDDVLVEIAVTNGVDREVIGQLMRGQ